MKLSARVSLADCFGIAIARRIDVELAASDHHEIDLVLPLGLCPVRFIC